MVRILYVEDNDAIRTTISDLIDLEDGFVVVGQAENGRKASAMLLEGLGVDVVITDINMPEMDGIELTQYITENYDDLKVIILTMHDKSAFLDRAFDAGAKGYLLKNGDMDELYTTIHKVQQGGTVIGSNVTSPN